MDELLEAAAREVTDFDLYEKEAELFRGKVLGGDLIAETFKTFSREEWRHFELFKIIYPAVAKRPPVSTKVAPGSSLTSILKMHFVRETQAIELYEKLLRRPLSAEHAAIVEKILGEEIHHLDTIKHYLKGLERGRKPKKKSWFDLPAVPSLRGLGLTK